MKPLKYGTWIVRVHYMEGRDLYNIDPIAYFQHCYDKKSSLYRFRTYFFNLNQTGSVGVLPSQNEDQRLLKQASEENPNHEKYYPVFGKGFEDLETRREWQKSYHAYQQAKIVELTERLDSAQRKMYLDVSHKTRKIKMNYTSILSKIISIIGYSHLLDQNFNNRLCIQEKNLFNSFTHMQTFLEKFKTKLTEISDINTSQRPIDVTNHQLLSEIAKVIQSIFI